MTSLALGNLNFDHDIKPLISDALVQSGFDGLQDDEVVVLHGCWHGLNYQQMSENSDYTVCHLQREAAKNLFNRLSDIFGVNVQKNTLHKVIAVLPTFQAQNQTPNSLMKKQRIIGKPPLCEQFIHRNEDFLALTKLLETNRVVALIGSSGIGKTSLVSKLFNQPECLPMFQTLVWKYSISSNLQEDISDLQRVLQIPKSTTVFDYINNRRVLICIDRIDGWFKDEKNEEQVYSFLRNLIEMQHDSCIVFTMREPIALLNLLDFGGRPVKILKLSNFSAEESKSLLDKYSLKGKKINQLISTCNGNPQHLHESAQCIERLYGGDIDLFLEGKTSLVLNVIKKNFSFIYSRVQEINDKERSILAYIASQVQDQSVLENDIIERLRMQFGYSIPHIIKILNILKSFNLVSAEDSLDPEISVPAFIAKYIQLNPEQFPSLALPA